MVQEAENADHSPNSEKPLSFFSGLFVQALGKLLAPYEQARQNRLFLNKSERESKKLRGKDFAAFITRINYFLNELETHPVQKTIPSYDWKYSEERILKSLKAKVRKKILLGHLEVANDLIESTIEGIRSPRLVVEGLILLAEITLQITRKLEQKEAKHYFLVEAANELLTVFNAVPDSQVLIKLSEILEELEFDTLGHRLRQACMNPRANSFPEMTPAGVVGTQIVYPPHSFS